MVTIDEICESVLKRNPTAHIDIIRRSHAFAAAGHAGQFRRSGDPYLVHPMGVAKITGMAGSTERREPVSWRENPVRMSMGPTGVAMVMRWPGQRVKDFKAPLG